MFDLLCLAILAAATWALRSIPPGFIYFWLKDVIVNEFLKMSVLTAAVEMAERVSDGEGALCRISPLNRWHSLRPPPRSHPTHLSCSPCVDR